MKQLRNVEHREERKWSQTDSTTSSTENWYFLRTPAIVASPIGVLGIVFVQFQTHKPTAGTAGHPKFRDNRKKLRKIKLTMWKYPM